MRNPLIGVSVQEYKEVRETRTVEYKLDASHIEGLLRASGITIPKGSEVRVFFTVPGGGDWSNEPIELDSENPVHVRITTQTLEVT